MNRHHQTRRKLLPGAEMLESRALLNAHVPHHAIVHHSAVAPHAITRITGTVSGQAPYTGENATNNVYFGTDAYTTSGSTNHGSASLNGQDLCNSVLINSTTFSDSYYGGNLTLTLSDGSTIGIAYVGSGHSPTGPGSYTARFQGEAIGLSGPEAGHMYAFTAKLNGVGTSETGNVLNGTVSIKFTLKG